MRKIKFAVIITNSDKVLIASRYKYITLLKKLYGSDMEVIDESRFNSVKVFKPDFVIVFGSFRNTFRLPLSRGIPYVLCDHDIVSLYKPKSDHDEAKKIRNAKKIIFTSPDHQQYIITRYNYPADQTMVLYLRPSIDDLNFQPLPKLPGKNIVYIGGLLDRSLHVNLTGLFGYRCYEDIFTDFMQAGWKVHLYAIRKRPDIYRRIGCIYHPKFNEGKDLFHQLSQFQVGLQGFNYIDSSWSYAKTCRPNKIWNYLAAGIPTVGINPGNGIDLYQNKWGYELKNAADINQLDFTQLDLHQYRSKEIIESQATELQQFIENL